MIRIQDLQYRYPDGTVALKGISLSIPDGEFLLICGPNGSGKTTLIRHLNGLLKPFSGSVDVDGFHVAQSPKEVIKRVGMVFQDADSQIVGETVKEDVAFGPENLGLSPAEVNQRVAAALEMVGLEHVAEKPCHLLSGGEKRRVAIAGVLAMQPHILVFDEPFANLDYSGTRQVLQQIVQLHKEGHTIVMTTHDVEKVIAHVDRIAIVYKGELKALGPPDDIIPQLSAYKVRPPCFSLLGKRAVSWLAD
ncbi:MAG: ABC transporter ATP-binding protein [Deltaproteobacteria bacterium]|nr:ABC transporter ATP-binding protein [Deltaproteobacteria bacterium]